MVWINNNATFLDRFNQVRSSTVRAMMLSMNLSTEDDFSSTYTSIVYDGNNISEAGRQSSQVSNRLSGD